jgi:methyltransferase (TIGR00027 family)
VSGVEDEGPDGAAARVALWRALHLAVDAPPHVLEDRIGLRLLAPGAGWRGRGDMDPDFTRPFRASIVARARFAEDLVLDQVARGVGQYVILGAGLDSFAQRRPDVAGRLQVFEIDRPGPQAWKRRRLAELGLGVPDWLRFVPADVEAGAWRGGLAAAGFDERRPAVVAAMGVSMYLTREVNAAVLRQVAGLAPGSTLALSFMSPPELLDSAMRSAVEAAARGARAGGSPFLSAFAPSGQPASAR